MTARPVSYADPRVWLKVEVHPLFPTSRVGPSLLQQETALASPALWASLTTRRRSGRPAGGAILDEILSIALQWPLERRLGKGKQKERNLVIHVEEDKRASPSVDSTRRLYVPMHLFPPFSTPPLSGSITRHEPISLSLVVLQPILTQQEATLHQYDGQETYNLDPLYGEEKSHPAKLVNGLSNGYSSSPRRAQVLRQGDTISLESTHQDGSPRSVRILLTEPVDQGVLSYSTQIVISNAPHILAADEPDWLDGDAASESSRGRTRLSMADFDPDAFLTTDLSFHSAGTDDLPEGPMLGDSLDLAQSAYSSTSGSITPKPGGRPLRTPSPPVPVDDLLAAPMDNGARFTAVRALGPSSSATNAEADSVCWVGVASLGRAGIFDGDWVLLRTPVGTSERIVKAIAWERLDEVEDVMRVESPANAILLPPLLHRALLPEPGSSSDILVYPTSFGARLPTLPTAKTMTLARIATTEGIDKRYERSWLLHLKKYFARRIVFETTAEKNDMRLVRRGDILTLPIERGSPIRGPTEDPHSDSDEESDDSCELADGGIQPSPSKQSVAPAVAYFLVTSLLYEPITSLEEDFSSSTSSKARAGELGCWVEAGEDGTTKMVLTGVERMHIRDRQADRSWHRQDESPIPYSLRASNRLRNMLRTGLVAANRISVPLSILVKGAQGAGKTSMLRSISAEVGYSLIFVNCYDLSGETIAVMQGNLQARVDKVKACAPSILVLQHVEALERKSDASSSARPPSSLQLLEDTLDSLRNSFEETAYPCLLAGLTSEPDAVHTALLSCFKQNVSLDAPDEMERLAVIRTISASLSTASDIDLKRLASQTAAFYPGDLVALLQRGRDLAVARALQHSQRPLSDLNAAGISITSADMEAALDGARAAYSERIDAPRIPNVSWNDVGGLAAVKADILDTIQLPLEHPELFAEGLKKRSGILLYGPPGTGKTLLAKAVATSCSLNFFSVKGPELLNMYIGESEANVRRVFQRARDASPCVIFMDELDSVAPKRGNQGDSGGVMDRIVSQLLAELDGMSSGDNSNVFVMGATNRPDLLDPALLRPGRFDRMLYLGVSQTHEAQLGILQALTRKFRLSPSLDLADIAEMCPFTYTGADFYALCSDAMLRAMTRQTESIDRKVEALNSDGLPHDWPTPLTVQYYLERLASDEEIQVEVDMGDFAEALKGLVPSVSQGEMEHYERVQREFKGFEIGRGQPNGHS